MSNKFLIVFLLLIIILTGCSKTQSVENIDYFKDLEVNEESRVLGEIVLALYPDKIKKDKIPIVSENQKNSELTFTLFHLEPSNLESYALLTSEGNTDSDMIAIVAPKLGYEIDTLIGLERSILKVLDGLDKEEQDKILVENVVLEQFEDTKFLILIISDNANVVFEEIKEGLKEWDASKVDVVTSSEETIKVE